jgi:hypothetical protein
MMPMVFTGMLKFLRVSTLELLWPTLFEQTVLPETEESRVTGSLLFLAERNKPTIKISNLIQPNFFMHDASF